MALKKIWVWKWAPSYWWEYLIPKDIGFDKGVEFAWFLWIIVDRNSK